MRKFYILSLSLALLAISACKSERLRLLDHHFDNKVYLEYKDKNPNENIIVKVDELSRTLSMRTALVAENEIRSKLIIDKSLLDKYKNLYNEMAVELLPEKMYQLDDNALIIKKGTVISNELTINFKNLKQLEREKVYVLPLALREIEGIKGLDRQIEKYYIFRGRDLINDVANLSQNRAYPPSFKNADALKNMKQATFEWLINPTRFDRLISTIMGVEGIFLFRYGDAGVPNNQLQLASTGGNITSSALQVKTGEWTHVAVTFDGDRKEVKFYQNGDLVLKAEIKKPNVDFSMPHHNEGNGSRVFWIGYSWDNDRYFDGKISEVRIWNKVLTREEIKAKDHFYAVDPQSQGLVAYWKFNEGEGKTVKDYSSSGNDLTCDKEPKWESVKLPAKK